MLIGAYMDIYQCLKVLKVPTGAYRCLQVGTGGRCLVIFKSAQLFFEAKIKNKSSKL